MKLGKIIIIILYSLSNPLSAQVPASLETTLITQSTGLTVPYNHFVYKDSDCFTWISSTHGLHRYDGKDIQLYTPRAGDSSSLQGQIVNGYFFEDSLKNIWFSTYDAVNCYERSKNQFISFADSADHNPGYFTCALDSLGQLWMLHENELKTFDIRSKKFISRAKAKPGAIRAEAKLDNKGYVQFVYVYDTERSNPGLQVMSFKDNKLLYTKSYFDIGSPEPVVIRDILIDADGGLWIASQKGLYHFDQSTDKKQMFTPFPEKEFVYFNAIENYNDSLLFIVSYGLGAFTFNVNQSRFDENFQLVSNGNPVYGTPQALHRDRNGGIWISIYSVGVAYFHPDIPFFRNYKHNLGTELLPNAMMNPNSMIELPDGRVWVGSRLQGAVLMNDAESILKKYNIDETKNWAANNSITSFLDHAGRVWILSLEGPLLRYPDDRIIHLDREKKYSSISIGETRNNELILGHTNGGLYKCIETPAGQFSFYKIKEVDSSKTFTLLYLHKDGLLYGSADLNVLEIFDPQNNFKQVQSLDFKVDVQCMSALPGTDDLWIGTDWGLYIYSKSTKSLIVPEWLSDLSPLIIYCIIPENNSNVWLSTNQGIYRLDRARKSIQSFPFDNGAGNFNFIRNTGMRRSNGEIWFGTIDGITFINPQHTVSNLKLSPVNFTNLLVNDAPASGIICRETGSTNIIEFKRIRLPYHQNTITIQYNALNYAGPHQTNYEYRMVGLNNDWVSNQQRDLLRFANLSPGQYTFEVRAVGGFTGSASGVRSLQIDIIAPLYMRNWFVALVWITVLSGLILVYLWNQRRKEHLQKLAFENRLALESQRLRIASDMHDDIGSGISAISLRTKLLAEDVQAPHLQKQIQELIHQTNSLSQQVRETIWTINSKNDTVDSLITKLHQYATDYFDGTGIECEINLMPEQVTNSITGSHRREIYLSFKEALHNIQKHSKANKVTIDIFVEGKSTLIIQIHDNGIGFDTKMPQPGLGITSMQKRLESISGIFRILSDETGTNITFIYPF